MQTSFVQEMYTLHGYLIVTHGYLIVTISLHMFTYTIIYITHSKRLIGRDAGTMVCM